MDYLRTLGSAAVSTIVQKSGLNLPFSLGNKLPQVEGYYNLYDATKRDDGSPVSVFEYDLNGKNVKPFAQNSLRKLRTTRHPDVLKFMEVVESDSTIYIMTERVRPLSSVLSQYSSKSQQEREDWLVWGLQRISVALTFINDQCLSTHGKICVKSIFISPSGEWKLGGFEVFSSPRDDNSVLYTLGGLLPGSNSYAPPEVKKSGWSSLKEADVSAADAYALGLLLHSVFNPTHPRPPTVDPPHPPPQPNSRGTIPTSLFPHFKKLLNPNPKARFNAKAFLEFGMADSGFFSTNRLVQVCAGLDNFALASEAEKASLLRTLKESASSFPPEFASNRILPSLLSALEYGGTNAATILPLVLQFGVNVTPEEYPKLILTHIIKLYASADRGTRMALLEHLPEYVDKLDKKAVSDKIFPHLQLGFSDTVSVIREATVKSIITFAPKLTDRILNNDLLRLLAKMQTDTEPSIRTNTCILIGRLGPSLGYNTKRKVLVPAFSRALRDPFVHTRVAGLMAFMATMDCFEVPEIATKVIPNMAFSLVDDEKLVRDQAFKALEIFVKKVQEYAANMPETAINKEVEGIPGIPGVASNTVPGALVNSAAGAAGSLAGWAISSINKKLAATDLQAPMPGGLVDRSNSAPPDSLSSHIGELSRPTFSTPNHSSPAVPTLNGASGSSSAKTKGLQLGANKVSTSVASVMLADQIAEEAGSAGVDSSTFADNPWGTDDLLDVNADDDDWSAFETAPTTTHIRVSTFSTSASAIGSISNLSTTAAAASPSSPPQHPRIPSIQTTQSPLSRPLSTLSASSSAQPTPQSQHDGWGASDDWDEPTKPSANTRAPASPAAMTKDEKAAEMARRKEERKQRIAMLKEQKKGKT